MQACLHVYMLNIAISAYTHVYLVEFSSNPLHQIQPIHILKVNYLRSVSMVAGCPRTVSPPPEEVVVLGREMVEWVLLNKPIHLSQWYSGYKQILYKDWKALIQLKEFLPYYEQALGVIGLNYLAKNSEVEPNLKQRWLRVYFKDLREEEDETARYNSELRREEAKKVDDTSVAHLTALMAQIESLQSNRSIDSNNISIDK